METSNSGANRAVFHTQNDMWGLGPIEIINSGHNVAVVNPQNHRWGLGPMETCNSDLNVAVLHAKKHRWGLGSKDKRHSVSEHPVLPSHINWRSQGSVETINSGHIVAVVNAQTTDEGWDPWRLVILIQKSLFCMQKPQMRAGTHRDL